MDSEPIKWSSQYVASVYKLPGDKIILPQSALQELLNAAPTITSGTDSQRPTTSSFDPFNPYTYAAERAARQLQYQDRIQQLPHPLTFRLVNPANGRVVYAGIREFSANEGEAVLSPFLKEVLGLEDATAHKGQDGRHSDSEGDSSMTDGVEELGISEVKGPRITIHAQQISKGTFVKLRPLEAGYNPEDWKALLEQYLRSNFTTLTNGEVLVVPGGRGTGGKKEEFRFLVDGFQPEGDGICIVDTDLEVDIEALNEEQARETLQRIAAKQQKAPGTDQGSSVGGELSLFREQQGQVLAGEYVDFEIPSWARSQGIDIELSGVHDGEEVDLYVSPYAPRQRAKPREDEYVFGDFSSRPSKRIRLQPTNVELEDAEALWVSVRAYTPTESVGGKPSDSAPRQFNIRASPFDPSSPVTNGDHASLKSQPHNEGDVQCKNCLQWVPQRTLMLHENFCLRNNILCPHGCSQVFQKRSPTYQSHWHCDKCTTGHGNTALSKTKHNHLSHTPQPCSTCEITFPSMSELAHHRVTVCPAKLILCQFCHLEVAQEGDPNSPNAEALLSGLTVHELQDGSRTTECHLCDKIVRLRDMSTHLRHHEYEKTSRPPPRVCRNVNCGRTLDGVSRQGDTRAGTKMGQGSGNDVGLCSTCFGPLYVAMYDPEGKALRRRVERRYLQQLLTGCGKGWCGNEFCKTAKANAGVAASVSSTKDAVPMVKPFLDGLASGATPLHFCVDEGSQRRRRTAEMMAAESSSSQPSAMPSGEKAYAFEWCVAALEAEGGDLDRARAWLRNWAPAK
ncbi:hypothetical protein LTS18_006626 [Coniosporium uncinatum]|uniref:Uncharacterized protein n=1 Tax=Coniosporium uncinatum TaxID=93489 RepID=A0ACC3DB15_9PEZI|nr:hypothetical protein LTS18_006626 [Coniosporium uncinatum]